MGGGMSGNAVVLGVLRQDSVYEVWELFTDTPTDDQSTSATLRQYAMNIVESQRRQGRYWSRQQLDE